MSRDVKLKALTATFSSETGKKPASVKSTLSRWARAGMPCTRKGKEPLFDVEECRAWIVANKPGWFPDSKPQASAQKTEAKPAGPDPLDKPLLDIIRNAEKSQVERLRASCQLSYNALARAAERGEIGVKHFSDLERVSKELRQAEAEFLENAQRMGELIPRAVSLSTLGELVQRLKIFVDNFTSALPTQVEIWQTPEFLAQDAEARSRQVLSWAMERFVELTTLESQSIKQLLEERLKREGKDGAP